jgi:HlyD family secretion protein
MKKRGIFLARLAVTVAALAAVAYLILQRISTSGNANSSTGGPAETPSVGKIVPIPVVAKPAFIGDLILSVSASGVAKPVHEVRVVSRISGKIIRLPVREGTFVRKGELLMKLDDREYQLELRAARDRLLAAELNFGLMLYGVQYSGEDTLLSRTEERPLGFSAPVQHVSIAQDDSIWRRIYRDVTDILAGKKRRDMMAQKSGLAEAMIRFQRAELNLSYTEIRAPFSGYVADLQVREGDHVPAGKECFSLVDLSQMDVYVQVLESEIGRIRKGRTAHITFPAYPGKVYTGEVLAINPRVDPETKTVSVIVRIPNPEGKILPGMFATARIEAEILKDRLLVPREAILVRDERKLVFVVRKNKAVWCYVNTGQENEQYVEILSSAFNLQPGELVITEGHYTLVHDAPVRVVKSRP